MTDIHYTLLSHNSKLISYALVAAVNSVVWFRCFQSLILFFFFFFFQAEDGIRDGRVTGVQTCALPISKVLLNDAAVLFEAAGLGDVVQKNLRPGPGAAEVKAGTIDAMFISGGYPVPAIRDLAASTPVRLIPIEGEIVESLKKEFSRYQEAAIPAGVYPGIDVPTPSVGFSVLWLVNSNIDPDLVYAITKSLWNSATAKLLSVIEPAGNQIRLERALDGLSVPLHPGAARFYREVGLPVDSSAEAPNEARKSDAGPDAVATDAGSGKHAAPETDPTKPPVK